MPFTHPEHVRRRAAALARSGVTPPDVAEMVGASLSTIYGWLGADAPHLISRPQPCCRCAPVPTPPADPVAYVHLLGLYLGDGWLGRMRNGTYFLSVACDDSWPGLADECEASMRAVGARAVSRFGRQGCHDVKSYSKHWPCLFPQHGPGKKHERPIVLEPWQLALVREHPGRFLRGLFHSDGWRGHNVAVHRKDDQVIRYRYPRYEFTNRSDDIRRLCTDALDLLDIDWRPNGPWRISVNRRAAVAALDEHVGPKH